MPAPRVGTSGNAGGPAVGGLHDQPMAVGAGWRSRCRRTCDRVVTADGCDDAIRTALFVGPSDEYLVRRRRLRDARRRACRLVDRGAGTGRRNQPLRHGRRPRDRGAEQPRVHLRAAVRRSAARRAADRARAAGVHQSSDRRAFTGKGDRGAARHFAEAAARSGCRHGAAAAEFVPPTATGRRAGESAGDDGRIRFGRRVCERLRSFARAKFPMPSRRSSNG